MLAPFNHCPEPLIPTMLDLLSTESASAGVMSTPSQGIHEKTLVLKGRIFDELMVLYYHAFGSSFSCIDRDRGVVHTLSFVGKPSILKQQATADARHYTVLIQLMKLADLGKLSSK